MPTVPSELSAAQMHRARHVAESFGLDAARYDRARPRYPDEIISRIVTAAPGPVLLDVGIGTGIEARPLQAAGAHVLGVEPDARMADFARASGFDVEVATFEEWDPAGRSFDGLVCAQAWHWIDPVVGARKAAQVLRAGGLFAAFWNVGDLPAEVAGAFARVFDDVAPDAVGAQAYRRGGSLIDGYGAILDQAAEGLRAAGGFCEPDRWRLDWEHEYSRDDWLDAVPTQGGSTTLAPQRLGALLDGMGNAIDALGGRFTMHYGTLALVARRRG